MKLRTIGPMLVCILIYMTSASADNITYACSRAGCKIENKLVYLEAKDKILRVLQDFSSEPIRRLLKSGTRLIEPARNSLTRLLRDLNQVKFYIVAKGYVAPQGRFSGFKYLVESKSVYLTMGAFETMTSYGREVAEGILLHEALGALGNVDDDYQISALLMALSRHSGVVPLDLQSYLLKFEERASSPVGPIRMIEPGREYDILAGGGSTESGGGGDALMAFVKSMVIQTLVNDQATVSTIINILQNLRLENQIVARFSSASSDQPPVRIYPLSSEDFLRAVRIEFQDPKCIYLISWMSRLGSRTTLPHLHKNVLAHLNHCGEKFNEAR
jgi:hypothetical protein